MLFDLLNLSRTADLYARLSRLEARVRRLERRSPSGPADIEPASETRRPRRSSWIGPALFALAALIAIAVGYATGPH